MMLILGNAHEVAAISLLLANGQVQPPGPPVSTSPFPRFRRPGSKPFVGSIIHRSVLVSKHALHSTGQPGYRQIQRQGDSSVYYNDWLCVEPKRFFYSILFLMDFIILIWIMLFKTFGAYAVTDICLKMLADIDVNLLPIAFIISNLFAERA